MTAAVLTRGDGVAVERRTRRTPVGPTRIVSVGAMCVVLTRIASQAFGELVPALLAVPVIVTAVAVVVRRALRKVRAGVMFVAAAAATVLAGLLVGATLGDVWSGIVSGPRKLLSTEWPSPREPEVVVAVAALTAAVTALATELAGRARLHVAPLVVMTGGLAAAMAVAAPVQPSRWWLAALGVGAVIVLAARQGNDLGTRWRALVGDRSVPINLAVLALAAGGAGAVVAWTDRADPRRIEEVTTAASLVDPMESVVALRQVSPPIPLFRIADRSALIGPSLPTRWRLAAFTEYDGQRWVPTLTLRPIGSRIGAPNRAPGTAPPLEVEIEVLTDDFDLVPLPGRPLEVRAGGPGVATDLERTAVQLASNPEPGDVIELASEVVVAADVARDTTVATRPVDEIAERFEEAARRIAGGGTVFQQLRAIEATMRDEWLLDSDAPGAGHQQALIERFVDETRRGTREQFATAFALMARSLGLDARVVTGFEVPAGELATPLELLSAHAAVWPEVRLADAGWVAFDPAPSQETSEQEDEQEPPSAQSPAAAQPPIPPPPEPDTDDDNIVVDDGAPLTGWASVRRFLTRTTLMTAGVLFPILAVLGGIVAFKWLRRRRRLRAKDPARRIAGAWANATDSLIDAGLAIQRSWTDDAIARNGAPLAPGVPHELRRLAASATAVTFGRASRGARLVDDAVATSRAVDDAIRAERSWWQRMRWRLSLRSLRRPTRSPITP